MKVSGTCVCPAGDPMTPLQLSDQNRWWGLDSLLRVHRKDIANELDQVF
jgi:hypothetical protein